MLQTEKDDSILIASKDSIARSMDKLEDWSKNEDIFLVIDETHHAAARTYRNIIDYVYGQTLVFALNREHAIRLNALFDKYGKKYGVKSAFIVSDLRDVATGEYGIIMTG